jgi:dTDP-4-amino-4,6-dideoxygalactose transaminase
MTGPLKNVPSYNSLKINTFITYISSVYNQGENGKRDSLREYLSKVKIPTMIYYPGPLHMQEAYRVLGYGQKTFLLLQLYAGKSCLFPFIRY